MASSSSLLPNLFSFFTPTKASPPLPTKASPPPTHLPQFSLTPSRNKIEMVPLVPAIDSTSLSPDVMSVVCPSLAHANTLFFQSAYNVQVIVDDNEPEEKLLNRFRREVMRAGVIQECRRRRYFETKQDEKKRKTREAAKRNRRRRPQSRNFSQDKQESSRSKREDEEEDNWELPQGDLPY